MTYFSPRKINDLALVKLHIVAVSAKTSRLCTLKEKNKMSLNQLLREDLLDNIMRMSHNIYHVSPGNLSFWLNPLAFVILTKVILYILLTVIALATIYYSFHFACLLDDACFALNYEVKI